MTRHELRENLLVALDTLRARKIRSALTILGIVIGVTSVISVAAIIDGLNGYIQSRIQSFGSRSFFVTRIPPGFTGLAPLPQKVRLRKYLDPSDAQYLKETVDGLDVINGQPGSLATWMDGLELKPGARVLHVGCATGY